MYVDDFECKFWTPKMGKKLCVDLTLRSKIQVTTCKKIFHC